MPLLAVEISSIQHKREIPRPSESICQLLAPQVDALVFHSHDLGLSENSVPLNPMVNDHYPY